MVGHMDMCLPKFFGWMDYQIFLGVLSSTIIVIVYHSHTVVYKPAELNQNKTSIYDYRVYY